MRIGEFVKAHVDEIFRYCAATDGTELLRLMDARYSRIRFGINYPFCIEVAKITLNERYWQREYRVAGKAVRVCNDWYDRNRMPFVDYLRAKGLRALPVDGLPPTRPLPDTARLSKGRFRSYPIGNAQNGVIRNILSNVGEHAFSEADWLATKSAFGDRCAYCREEKPLIIDHAMPINRANLGEHHLGNLVPSCGDCNAAKGGSRDFIDFLSGDNEKINRIIDHMTQHGYAHLGKTEKAEQIKAILELAHREVGALAQRYIAIIDALLDDGSVERRTA